MAEAANVSANFALRKGMCMKTNIRIYEVKSEYIKYLSTYQKHMAEESD